MSQESKTKDIYFLHIRKTGGTSLLKTIKRSPLASRVIHIKGFQTYFYDSLFKPQESQESSIIQTHSYYGIHSMNWKHLLNSQKYTYITLLRDPIERAISYYFYVKRDRPERYENGLYKTAKKYNIEDFYRLPKMDNGQTRILSGLPSKYFESCHPWLLKQAQKNLTNGFTAIGITERFAETLELIKQTFDWPLKNQAIRAKHNKNKPKRESLSPQVIQALRETHQLDLELYQFAQELFEKQLKAIKPHHD